MNRRKIVLLGSTGSIGRSTLDVIDRHPDSFELVALAAHSNVELLAEQYRRYRPQYLCLTDENQGKHLREAVAGERVELLFGEDQLVRLASLPVDIVVNAVVGAVGLLASLATVKRGGLLALANKESMVAGGPLFPKILKRTGARILPIDSEHSALWQALAAGKATEVRRLIITASGGPFREWPIEKFESITPAQALKHPTWKMGPKITIDSATLANKGLEVMEAVGLFEVPVERVSVVIHPQSIIHSMVEYVDSSIIAQISSPDMRLPISYALFWPDRVESEFGHLEPSAMTDLTFEEPDMQRFGALRLAFEAARSGGTAPAVYNAANEVAVTAFLEGSVKFTEITDIIENTVNTVPIVAEPNLDDILAADDRARIAARERIGKASCC